MHGDVFIKNIVDDSIAIRPRISLQVDAFKRLLHDSIAEGDISYTVDLWIGRDSADSQTHSQSNSNVLDEHILSAVDISIIIVMCRLGHNHVIVILAGDVVDVEVSSIRIDAVSIEGEERNSADQVESFEDAKLGGGIDTNVQVEDSYINRLINFKMEGCRILEDQVMNGQFSCLVNSNQMRSTCSSRHVLLGNQPTIQPPDVSPPVYLPPAVDSNVIAKFYPDEVLVIDPIGVVRPMLDAVAGRDLPPNFNHNVIAVVDAKGQRVELALRNHYGPCIPN